jgi:cytochrome c-type biogenesis protein CcmH/NrfG
MMPRTASSPGPIQSGSREHDAEKSVSSPAGGSPKVSLAILGLFGLASIGVLLVSWPGLKIARHTRRAEAALEAHAWAEAVPHLESITARFPGAWLRQRQLGDCYLQLEEPEKALDAYQHSLDREPGQALRSRIGRALYLLDPDNPEAARFIEEAQQDDPADARANFYVAMLRLEQGRYREAAYFFLGASSEPLWFERSRPYIEQIREQLLGDNA